MLVAARFRGMRSSGLVAGEYRSLTTLFRCARGLILIRARYCGRRFGRLAVRVRAQCLRFGSKIRRPNFGLADFLAFSCWEAASLSPDSAGLTAPLPVDEQRPGSWKTGK